jgi:hypothetical protein
MIFLKIDIGGVSNIFFEINKMEENK